LQSVSFADEAVCYIDKWYDNFVTVLCKQANAVIPCLKKKALKFWWSDEANVYKQKAIEHHYIWTDANKPKSGIFFDNMKDSKYKYKLFLKNQKATACNKITNSLTDCLENKNKTQF